MPFTEQTKDTLQFFTQNEPIGESVWYGPWTTILTTIFPADEGFMVTPQLHVHEMPATYKIPDFIIQVKRVFGPTASIPKKFRTVLIVEVKPPVHWAEGFRHKALYNQLNKQLDSVFNLTGWSKLFWLVAIGPHWRYGYKCDDGQMHYNRNVLPLPTLSEWHHTIHSNEDYDAL